MRLIKALLSFFVLCNVFLRSFSAFQSMLFMIQHIPGGQTLSRTLGSSFAAAAAAVASVVSDSVRPHRRQPTRLPRPWDSQGKNTGVGCHFLFIWDPQSWLLWCSAEVQCLPSHPSGTATSSRLLFCLAWMPCTGNWQMPQGGNRGHPCVSLLSACDVLALSVVFCVPSDSSVCFLVSYVIFVVAFSEDFGLILLFLMA